MIKLNQLIIGTLATIILASCASTEPRAKKTPSGIPIMVSVPNPDIVRELGDAHFDSKLVLSENILGGRGQASGRIWVNKDGRWLCTRGCSERLGPSGRVIYQLKKPAKVGLGPDIGFFEVGGPRYLSKANQNPALDSCRFWVHPEHVEDPRVDGWVELPKHPGGARDYDVDALISTIGSIMGTSGNFVADQTVAGNDTSGCDFDGFVVYYPSI